MSTLVDAVAARFQDGYVIVTMAGGLELRFPAARNPRLAGGTPAQLNNIEVSPFGLHWPDLDEDLSFKGLLAGDYGQSGCCHASCAQERHAALLENCSH
ncbi:DUF2442 domain-containing protein [Candidatus Electronema sp. TJ]|uniref:DUF2442 domain-containing protein n=1 Tax=Candidatus Electronema sp. TJ TaxID=3401573 RepID=UPI003AA8633B